MRHVYARLGAILGMDGALYAYSNDVNLVSDHINMYIALAVAHIYAIYAKRTQIHSPYNNLSR
jgi:hypothetical protein